MKDGKEVPMTRLPESTVIPSSLTPHPSSLSRSYTYCERLTRREAGNFYHAFRILPADQRRAMCALYAFLRVADDLADGPGDPTAKRMLLADWRRRFDRLLAGEYSHLLHAALHATMRG